MAYIQTRAGRVAYRELGSGPTVYYFMPPCMTGMTSTPSSARWPALPYRRRGLARARGLGPCRLLDRAQRTAVCRRA